MTIPRDEVLRMARESCAPEWWDEAGGYHMGLDLIRFAALVAAAEREACAEIAADSDHVVDGRGYYDQLGDANATARNIEAAIRARGAAAIGRAMP